MKRWLALIALMLVAALGASAETATLQLTPGQFSEKLNAIQDIFGEKHFRFPTPKDIEGDIITIAFRSPVTLTAKVTEVSDAAEIEQLMVQSLDGDVDQVRRLGVQCFAAAAGISDREHASLVTLAAFAPEDGLLSTRPFASENGIELNFYIHEETGLVAVVETPTSPDP